MLKITLNFSMSVTPKKANQDALDWHF